MEIRNTLTCEDFASQTLEKLYARDFRFHLEACSLDPKAEEIKNNFLSQRDELFHSILSDDHKRNAILAYLYEHHSYQETLVLDGVEVTYSIVYYDDTFEDIEDSLKVHVSLSRIEWHKERTQWIQRMFEKGTKYFARLSDLVDRIGDIEPMNTFEEKNPTFSTQGIVDGIGYRIDPGVEELVLYFNVLGFTTVMSCEGHEINPAENRPESSPCVWVTDEHNLRELLSLLSAWETQGGKMTHIEVAGIGWDTVIISYPTQCTLQEAQNDLAAFTKFLREKLGREPLQNVDSLQKNVQNTIQSAMGDF